VCWGANNSGQLGNGLTAEKSPWPSGVIGVGATDEMVAGAYHGCVRTGGSLMCWGTNQYYERGVVDAGPLDGGPNAVPGISDGQGLGAGYLFSCAIVAGGEVKCWGDDDHGQSAVGPFDGGALCSGYACNPTPAKVSGVSAAAEVRLGSDFACARRASDGTIWCWGANYNGSLGHTTADAAADSGGVDDLPHATATQVPDITGAIALAVGAGGHACAVTATGDVTCWGSNDYGELGHDPAEDRMCIYRICRTTPSAVPGIANVTELALGALHSCALTTAGAVYCWGENQDGQLGHDGATDTFDAGGFAYTPMPTLVALPPPHTSWRATITRARSFRTAPCVVGGRTATANLVPQRTADRPTFRRR
jgi:alpha-tubulin suppressor-like RCC1 family protein